MKKKKGGSLAAAREEKVREGTEGGGKGGNLHAEGCIEKVRGRFLPRKKEVF